MNINCRLHGSTTVEILDKTKAELTSKLKDKHGLFIDDINDSEVTFNLRKHSQLHIFLYAETDTGCVFHGSGSIYNDKSSSGDMSKRIESGVEHCVDEYIYLSESGICVGENLQDQLIIFMALAKGISKMFTCELSLHTQTAIYFAEMFTAARYTTEPINDSTNVILTCTSPGLDKKN